jgi:hypothetical protein
VIPGPLSRGATPIGPSAHAIADPDVLRLKVCVRSAAAPPQMAAADAADAVRHTVCRVKPFVR